MTIHCGGCHGTGRVLSTAGDFEHYAVCLSCEGSGLIRLTPEQSAERQRNAEAQRLQQVEDAKRYQMEAQERKAKQNVLLIIGIAIAILLIVFACRLLV